MPVVSGIINRLKQEDHKGKAKLSYKQTNKRNVEKKGNNEDVDDKNGLW